MADIKTKESIRNIKTKDSKAFHNHFVKNVMIDTKDRVIESSKEESPDKQAVSKVQQTAKHTASKGVDVAVDGSRFVKNKVADHKQVQIVKEKFKKESVSKGPKIKQTEIKSASSKPVEPAKGIKNVRQVIAKKTPKYSNLMKKNAISKAKEGAKVTSTVFNLKSNPLVNTGKVFVNVIKKVALSANNLMAAGSAMVLVVCMSLFLGCFSALANESSIVPAYIPLSEEVLAYQPVIEQYCEEYHIEEYVGIVMAIMMQESGGRGNDPMQCSESGYNTEYPRVPNGITDPEYSIKIGIKTFASCIEKAGVESPGDTEKLSLAIQAYNYGEGYISWAVTNFGGYTKANARVFSDQMKAQLGTSVYGDPEYVDHVLRYVYFGFGELRSQPNFSNAQAWGSNNPYTASWMGQCTWFAWARFYEIYGYSPEFTGSGYQCVGQLLAAHGDKFGFSTEPAVGAIFSYNAANNHVGFVVAVEGNNVTVQEGNVGDDYAYGGSFPGVAWNYPFDISKSSTPFGWWEHTYTKSDMASRGVTYAVPKNPIGLESTVTIATNGTAPSIDYLAQIANKKYGMSRQNVVDALKLCTNEGMTASDILPYYMACTTINHYLAHPEMNLLRNWGGGAAQRYFDKLNPKPESYIQNFAKINFYKALNKLDKRA